MPGHMKFVTCDRLCVCVCSFVCVHALNRSVEWYAMRTERYASESFASREISDPPQLINRHYDMVCLSENLIRKLISLSAYKNTIMK